MEIMYLGLLGALAAVGVGLLHMLGVFLPIWLQVFIMWLLVWVLMDILVVTKYSKTKNIDDLYSLYAELESRLMSIEGIISNKSYKQRVAYATLYDIVKTVSLINSKIDRQLISDKKTLKRSLSEPNVFTK